MKLLQSIQSIPKPLRDDLAAWIMSFPDDYEPEIMCDAVRAIARNMTAPRGKCYNFIEFAQKNIARYNKNTANPLHTKQLYAFYDHPRVVRDVFRAASSSIQLVGWSEPMAARN